MLVGIACALLAACTNSCIDTLRKAASTRIHPTNLVALPALLEALLACTCILLGGSQSLQHIQHPLRFAAVTITSSTLLLYSKYLYSTALSIAPLSLTVPFLSFTPAILVILAFLFLGERPSAPGVLGVAIITLGGCLLTYKNAGAKQTSASGSPDPLGLHNDDKAGKAAKWAAGSAGQQLGGGGGGVTIVADAVASGGANHLSMSRNRSLATLWSGSDPEDPKLAKTALSPKPTHDADTASASAVGARSRNASLQLGGGGAGEVAVRISPAAPPGGSAMDWVPAHALQWHGHAAPSPQRPPPGGGERGGGGAAGPADHGGGGGAGGLLPSSSATGYGGGGYFAALRQHPGSLMMMGVACLWSVTASLDKLGTMYAPSIWVYIACQRACIALLSNVSLALSSPSSFSLLRTHLGILLLIAVLELAAVALFFEAIKHIFVSYVVAIKRCNILLSVLVGGFFFKESILARLPYICLMLAGMSLIVLEPNSAALHAQHT